MGELRGDAEHHIWACMECGARWHLAQLIAGLREREPLRNDAWVKGYHAALVDVETKAGFGE